MKKKPDRKLVFATLALLAGAASASFSKGIEIQRSTGIETQGAGITLPAIYKKSLSPGAS